jgi:hypothetical protein
VTPRDATTSSPHLSHFKRVLWLEWPAGAVTAHTFGQG